MIKKKQAERLAKQKAMDMQASDLGSFKKALLRKYGNAGPRNPRGESGMEGARKVGHGWIVDRTGNDRKFRRSGLGRDWYY